MNITLFGSCRIGLINHNNNLNNLLNYTHSTKEIIQLINFLKGELIIPEPYNKLCFRTAIRENKYINYNDLYRKLFIDTTIFIIEICSNKNYIHNNFYLHHLCVDKRFSHHNDVTPKKILNTFVIEKQKDDEIETDILEIQKLLYPKKIIIVSHYNSKQTSGEYLPARNHLVNLLSNICNKHNIIFINPVNALINFAQEEIMSDDLGHYTDKGKNEFANYMNEYIKSINLF